MSQDKSQDPASATTPAPSQEALAPAQAQPNAAPVPGQAGPPAYLSQEFRGKVEELLAGKAQPANADSEWAVGELRGIAAERDAVVKSLKELSEQQAMIGQQLKARQTEFERIDGHMTALVKVLHRSEGK